MKFFQAILSVGMLFVATVSGEEGADYEYGQDPEQDAIYDMQLGFNGLQEAAKNPKLLAQLMQDLQDPELLEEAKKMMEGKDFKKQMGTFEQSKEFKEASKKVKEMMDDPVSAARMQAQMEHMVQRGEDGLKKDAKNAFSEAFDAMADPAVMGEAMKMMTDPKFVESMKSMAKDPQYRHYMAAIKDMIADPEKKAQIEKISEGLKGEL